MDARFAEPVAGAVANVIVAAGTRVYALTVRVRRWADNGLEDIWPDDVRRLRDAVWAWGGMPALAARAAGIRTAAWLWAHRVLLVALLMCSLLTALGGTLAFQAAARGAWHVSVPVAQSMLSAQPQQVGPGIVLQPQGTPTPTIGLPTYMVGAWPSASSPSAGATVLIYVRVTDSASLRPVSGATVTLAVQVTCAYPYRTDGLGPKVTGADGIAAIPVRVSGMLGGQPVCVTATVHIGGQVLTATATFAPL